MKRITVLLFAFLLAAHLAVPGLAAEFSLEETATLEGMGQSWYQGYAPEIRNHVMTLYLPVRAQTCVGEITVSIALNDPHVFLLRDEPQAVTVLPRGEIYPVKLSLPLERNRRNGDFPATVTLRGVDADGRQIVETMSYIIRIRDGLDSHETLSPLICQVAGSLHVGSEGSVSLTVTNPTTTVSLTEGMLTVTDATGEILMSGSDLFALPEILPGQSASVTVPMTVRADAAISQHTLRISLTYQALGAEESWSQSFTLPVTQAIRLEQGGVQLPAAIAGELADMTLPLMNMGRGELRNVAVKLEMSGVLDAQSVLVGTLAPGETKQAKLTFTPFAAAAGTHSGTVTYSCEDAYGNPFSQTLGVTLTVAEPLPEVEEPPAGEQEKTGGLPVLLIVLCGSLAAALAAQSIILGGKLRKLEEERL